MANVDTQRASALAGAAGIESTAGIGKPTFGISPHWCAGGRCGVLHRPIRVFVMWYGVFSEAQKQTVRSFVASLSPNADAAVTVPLWWNVNRQYHDQAGRRVAETVTWGGETDDAGYSRGATLYDADVTALVADAITSRRLAYDADGVYFVLSDASVAQAGSDNPQEDRFCVAFCGWHFFGSAPGFGTFITAWTGKADLQCPTSCIAADIRSNASLSPTGDPGMDGLVSVFAHELAEAAASPFVSTWFDSDGEENADKCSWTPPHQIQPGGVNASKFTPPALPPQPPSFPSLFPSSCPSLPRLCRFAPILTDPSEARYNLVGVNASKFLIQHNWDLLSASCKLTLPYPPPLTPPPPSQRLLRPLPASPPPGTINQAAKSIVSRVKAVLAGRGRPGRKRPPRSPVVRLQPSRGKGG
ncbi:unnamed protein product [Closterium sp. Naga37s-1]|nr:unnamed protein product [Closterium sp. Naga37s-1]